MDSAGFFFTPPKVKTKSKNSIDTPRRKRRFSSGQEPPRKRAKLRTKSSSRHYSGLFRKGGAGAGAGPTVGSSFIEGSRKKYPIVTPFPARPHEYSWVYTSVLDNYKNGCEAGLKKQSSGKFKNMIELKPYQWFVGKYFNPMNPLNGILLYYSIGSGKLCTGINTAYQFQKKGWNVLWVTRTTLKNDVDKNLIQTTCHEGLIRAIKSGEIARDTPESRRQYFLRHFKWIDLISFKAFTNLCAGRRTELSDKMDRLNGKADPFRRTVIVIDEAHKFLEPEQFSAQERPEFQYVESAMQRSYDLSGTDSCKLVLMTGTPVGSRPEDTLLRLMNVIIAKNKIVPDDFNNPSTLARKLRGLVLKLDISTDPSLFAQPKFEEVVTVLDSSLSSSNQGEVSPEQKERYTVCSGLTSLAKAKEVFPDMDAKKFKVFRAECKPLKQMIEGPGNKGKGKGKKGQQGNQGSQLGAIESCLALEEGKKRTTRKKTSSGGIGRLPTPSPSSSSGSRGSRTGSGTGSGISVTTKPKKKKGPKAKAKPKSRKLKVITTAKSPSSFSSSGSPS